METTEMRDRLLRVASDAGQIGRENFGEDVGRLATAVEELAQMILELAEEVSGK